MIVAIVSLWAVAHIYFDLFFPVSPDVNIQSINNLLVCAALGMLVLAARRYGKIKKDLMVDLFLLPILLAAGWFGPDFIRVYIWLFTVFAVLIPSAFVRGTRPSVTPVSDPRRNLEKHVVHDRTPRDGSGFG
jgi:hypothetical protein